MAKIAMGIGAIAGAVALTVVTGGGGAYALGGAIQLTAAQVSSMALSMGMMGGGMILSSISQALAGGGPSTSQSVRQPAGSRQTIYGQARVTGTVVYYSSINHTINQVIVWASHLCKSVDYIYLDGRQVYFVGGASQGLADGNIHYDPSGNSYNFTAGSGNHKVWCYSVLGTPAGEWIASLAGTISGGGGDSLNPGGDPSWTSNCTLNGLCATHVATQYDAGMFNGIPQVKAAIHGKCDIYDPRLGAQFLGDGVTPNPATHVWTDNAALIIADFLVNADYGFAFLWSDINITQLIAAANTCDEQVPLAAGHISLWVASHAYIIGQQIIDSNGRIQTVSGYGGGYWEGTANSGGSNPTWATVAGSLTYDNQITWTAGNLGTSSTESRYSINGAVDWASSPGDTLESLLAAMEGRISFFNGQVQIYPAAWYGSTLSFGMGDLVGNIKTSKKKQRELANAMRGTFLCPSYPYNVVGYDKNHKDNGVFDGQWQPVDIPSYAQDALHGYSSDANLTADGGVKLYEDRRYQFVTSCSQAQRLLKIYLLRNRQQWSGTLSMSLAAFQTCPNDAIQFTAPIFNWAGKLLEVKSFKFVPNFGQKNEAPTLSVELEVNETDPSIYTWSPAEELTLNNAASPMLTDSLVVSDPTGLALESGLDSAVIGADGVVTPRIRATWTQPSDPYVTSGGSIVIQYQKVGDTGWTQFGITPGTTTQVFITGVIAGQSYNVEIQARHAGGSPGNWVTTGTHTVSMTLSTFSGAVSASTIAVSGAVSSGTTVTAAQGVIIPDTTNGHTYQMKITNGAVALTQLY